MKLTLKDRVFGIDRATLSAAIPDPYWSGKYDPHGDARLSWSLDIYAKERIFDDESWRPYVYHQNLRIPIRRWFDVAGQVIEWTYPFDELSGEPNGGFYVFEHADLPRATLRFAARDGPKFRIHWEGLCNVFWGEEYGQDVPFSLEAWAHFTEVIVRGSEADTDDSLRARLAQYLDVRDFVQQPMQQNGHSYDDGVKMTHAVFVPVPQ